MLKIIGYEINIYDSKKYKYFDLEELNFDSNIRTTLLSFHINFEKKTKIEKKTVNQILNIFRLYLLKIIYPILIYNCQISIIYLKIIIETIKNNEQNL